MDLNQISHNKFIILQEERWQTSSSFSHAFLNADTNNTKIDTSIYRGESASSYLLREKSQFEKLKTLN